MRWFLALVLALCLPMVSLANGYGVMLSTGGSVPVSSSVTYDDFGNAFQVTTFSNGATSIQSLNESLVSGYSTYASSLPAYSSYSYSSYGAPIPGFARVGGGLSYSVGGFGVPFYGYSGVGFRRGFATPYYGVGVGFSGRGRTVVRFR